MRLFSQGKRPIHDARRAWVQLGLLLVVLLISGCELNSNRKASKGTPRVTAGGSSTTTNTTTNSSQGTTTKTVVVTWDLNREAAVNTTGGGYRVYYSTTNGFSLGSASYVNVPYSSGGLAPATASIAGLDAGTYYIKVVAYSSLNTAGSVSTQIQVVVP